MHYIRLLRPPILSRLGEKVALELLFTIATDLGDSFLTPDGSIDLLVSAETWSASGMPGTQTIPFLGTGKLEWRPGMRVAKPTVEVPRDVQTALKGGARVIVCISARQGRNADGVNKILGAVASAEDAEGQVMPVWFAIPTDAGRAADMEVSTRRLALNGLGDPDAFVEFEEEIGESIARHIWDAGVIAFCAMANACMSTPAPAEPSCLAMLKDLLNSQQPLNVLELGCGVGILGVGLGAVYARMRPPPRGKCTVLMTDLEEAEKRARANMSRLTCKDGLGRAARDPAVLLYENLDWEDGRRGRFGPEARSRRWELIMLSDCTYNVDMLPALVETLSALHSSNLAHASPNDGRPPTRVFLATKPRHASERALFDLMSREGWCMLRKQTLPLPVVGSETESVELYVYEKL